MIINQVGSSVNIDGISYSVGQAMIADDCLYYWLPGVIVEIRTEDDMTEIPFALEPMPTVELRCDIRKPDSGVYSEIITRAGEIYGQPITSVGFSGVTFYPHEVILSA